MAAASRATHQGMQEPAAVDPQGSRRELTLLHCWLQYRPCCERVTAALLLQTGSHHNAVLLPAPAGPPPPLLDRLHHRCQPASPSLPAHRQQDVHALLLLQAADVAKQGRGGVHGQAQLSLQLGLGSGLALKHGVPVCGVAAAALVCQVAAWKHMAGTAVGG